MEQVGKIIVALSVSTLLYVLATALVIMILAICIKLATYIFDRIRRSYVEHKNTQYITPEDPYPDYELTENEEELK